MKQPTTVFLISIILTHNAAASFKDDCLNLHNARMKSTFIDGRCVTSKIAELLTQAEAQQRCLDLAQQGQLAASFDQQKLSLIARLIDLSNGIWTSLLLDSNNETVWFNEKTGKNSSVVNPSWAAGFPDASKGAGILLRFDGLVSAQLESQHPFMCESFEKPPHQVKFQGGKNFKASQAVLSTETVTSKHECGIACAEEPRCQAYAFSSSSGECQLLWLNQDAMTPENDVEYKLLNRVHPEADCVAPSDCLAETSDVPRLVLVNSGVVSFESYYPDQSSLNSVLLNTTKQKSNPVAVPLNGNIVVTSHIHNSDPDQLSQATDTIVYNPSTNTMSMGGPAVEARHEPGAALLNGAIIMCGGTSSSATELTSCERFSEGQWNMMSASLNVGRHGITMANLHNNLYAIAGWNGDPLSVVERYDPTTDAWTLIDPLPSVRMLHGTTVFKDQIVVCGGWGAEWVPAADCLSYSDITGQWSIFPAMTKARKVFALVAFHGFIYALGDGHADRSVEKFDPQAGQWSAEHDTIQSATAVAIVV